MHTSVLYYQSIKLIIAKNRIKIGLSYQILDLFPETFAGHDYTNNLLYHTAPS